MRRECRRRRGVGRARPPPACCPAHSARSAETDREETTFGIRSIRFDAEQGFFLNGRHVEIQGTCNHQDHAGVGSALPDRLQAYRVERLKAFGCNAYRTSHNPPTPELLDACDRLGLLVLDETRLFASVEEGLSQLERLIRRDRNHPSVIAWSLENEEWFVQGNDRGGRIAATILRLARRLDPTRPVTAAMNGGWGSRVTELMDVQGFNYENRGAPADNVDAIHRRFPGKPMWGTEVASTVSTRGIYANDEARGYLSAYDRNKPDWGATAEEWWPRYAARAWLAGGFVKLIGVGNGDPSSHEADKGDTRRAFGGLCCAIVQAAKEAGELRIEATSPGLEAAQLVVPCRAKVSSYHDHFRTARSRRDSSGRPGHLPRPGAAGARRGPRALRRPLARGRTFPEPLPGEVRA